MIMMQPRFWKPIVLSLLVTSLAQSPRLLAQSTDPPADSQRTANTVAADETQVPPSAETVVVAILPFDSKGAGDAELGPQVATLAAAMLAGEPGIELVEREDLDRVLNEMGMQMTGLADSRDMIQAGRLVGAQVIVTGKCFIIGSDVYITAKVIGVATSRMQAVLVKGVPEQIGDVIPIFAAKLGAILRGSGELIATRTEYDPLPALKEALIGKTLPSVAIALPESHIRWNQETAPPDPAAATELKKHLLACGFTLLDTKVPPPGDPGDASREPEITAEMRRADVVIVGEAFSERVGQVGNLIGVAARVEIKLVDTKTNTVLLVDRTTQRAVDVGETIAAKTALQRAGRELAVRVLRHYARDDKPAAAKVQAPTATPKD